MPPPATAQGQHQGQFPACNKHQTSAGRGWTVLKNCCCSHTAGAEPCLPQGSHPGHHSCHNHLCTPNLSGTPSAFPTETEPTASESPREPLEGKFCLSCFEGAASNSCQNNQSVLAGVFSTTTTLRAFHPSVPMVTKPPKSQENPVSLLLLLSSMSP